MMAESDSLSQKVRLLEEQTNAAVQAARASEKNLQSLRSESEARAKADQSALEDLRKKADEASKALEDYKAKYRISARKKALQFKMDQLDCGDEGKFTAVEVLAINPAQVRFRHALGVTSVSLGLLNEDMRERFGYNAEDAGKWMEQEASKKEKDATDELLAQSAAATAQIKKLGQPGNMGINSGVRNHLNARLYSLNLSTRQLMINNKCCPVHKKWQLGMWAREMSQLRVQIARLPAVKGLQ